MFHRKWCKGALVTLRCGHPVIPYRVCGVGKSHVIKLIHSDTIKLLRLSGRVEPGQVTVLLTAPTGGALFNIGGMTLHSTPFELISLQNPNTMTTSSRDFYTPRGWV